MVAEKSLNINQILIILSRLDKLSIEHLNLLNKVCAAGHIRLDLSDMTQVACLTTLALRQLTRDGKEEQLIYNMKSSIVLNLFKFSTSLQVA